MYKPFWTKKIWPGWQGGSGKVKIWPRMGLAYIHFWLQSLLESPKWVKDSGNGPKMIPPTAPDWFESISGVLQRQAKWLKHSLQLCSVIISDNKENGKFVLDVIWEPPRPPSPYFNDWHSKLVPPKRKKINWIWIHTTACLEQQWATKTFKPHWNMNENSFLSDPSPIIGNACQWLTP